VALTGGSRSGEEVIVDGESDNLTKSSGRDLPGANSEGVRPEPASAMSWTQQAQRFQKKAHVFYFAFKHPRMPWYARFVAACTAGYLFSPIQLIPSFIPVIGFLDDFLVMFLGVKLLQKITPPDVLAECRDLAEKAEVRRKEEIRSQATVVAAVVIATLWLLAAVAASALLAAYIRH
jgi:uncharacterized membrane protein YkvA (DUF1232 family)